jgi:hypothetical protein
MLQPLRVGMVKSQSLAVIAPCLDFRVPTLKPPNCKLNVTLDGDVGTGPVASVPHLDAKFISGRGDAAHARPD